MADETSSAPAEYSGRTVDEATNRALADLNLRREQIDILVLTEGRPGILGVGAQPARIQVTVKPVRPAQRFIDEEIAPAAQPFFDAPAADEEDTLDVAAENEFAEEPEDEEEEIEDEIDEEEDDLEDEEAEDDLGEDEEAEAEQPVAPVAVAVPVHRERPPREPLSEDEAGLVTESAVDVLETLLQLMGFEAQVVAREPQTPGDGAGLIAAVLDVQGAPGEEMGLLIGRKGETLAALQYMLNLIVNHQTHAHATFGIDVEGYRQRREAQLEDLARRVADRVRRDGQPMTLEPMPPAERRIVHMALAEDPDVQTVSIGEGDARKVAITLKT
jgi:spoIIIJ-associated protein